MDKKPKPTSIRINAELKSKLEEMAKADGRSFNNLVARILEQAAK
ncbi:MAG: ribbon-helix-helix domain-containing protein [Colwellia sp.]|nr:ribbon-helix-helix domain-containing protein [Colwellia sp.]